MQMYIGMGLFILFVQKYFHTIAMFNTKKIIGIVFFNIILGIMLFNVTDIIICSIIESRKYTDKANPMCFGIRIFLI